MEFPTEGPVILWDRLDVMQLVAYLRRETRSRPVVVLTVDHGHAAPFVDPEVVAREAGGRADIVVLPTDDLTRALSDSVKPGASVYRGACRVYPPGDAWERNPWSVPLRMTRNQPEIDELPRLLLADLRRVLDRPATMAPSSGVAASAQRTPGTPTPRDVASSVPVAVGSESDAAALAAYLESPGRRRPVVVLSRAATASTAYADVERLRADLAGLAEVFEITSLEASWGFSRIVPPMCQVYGGAGRVYPQGVGWRDDPYLSPLRFAYGLRDRVRVTRELVSDAMGMVAPQSLTVGAQAGPAVVEGAVIGVAGERGLVDLGNGQVGVVWPELVEPGLSAERLFAKGMTVWGDLDPESRRIDVRGMRQDSEVAVAGYRAGDTILVRVARIGVDSCSVDLFPGLTVTIPAEDIADYGDSDLRALMSLGETLPALVVEHDRGTREWLLSLIDAADVADAVVAPGLLVGGPAWLVPSRSAPGSVPEPVSATPQIDEQSAPASDELVRGLRMENEQLLARNARLEMRVANLESELATARTQRRESARRRSRVDRAAAAQDRAEGDLRLFLDPRDQLDFEIGLAWARITLAPEKPDYPMKPYSISDQFLDTLRDLEGVARDKVVEVMVHILTGRHADLASREVHQLRTGTGGDDPPVTRAGGETCWRVSLQAKTPSARRLHYWSCNDGSVEFSSVRVHDDFRP